MKTLLSITCVTFLVTFILTGDLFGQTTSIQIPTAADSSSSFRVLNNAGVSRLKVNSDGGFYLGGDYGTGVIPATGSGTRFIWYPGKAALRAGYVTGSQWNDANIGIYSVGLGTGTIASGSASMATGYGTNASGNYSVAMGGATTASGQYSVAMGYLNTTSGDYSTAMGYGTTASGTYSTAMGNQTTASGYSSVALGGSNSIASGMNSTMIGSGLASGNYSMALGYWAIAEGERSIALGNYVKAKYTGSFFIGDYSHFSIDSSSTSNQMSMRFANGYRLFTNSVCTTGVTLAAGASSWGTVSDSTKKTDFEKADGEYFLKSLSHLKLGSWNYIGQDAKNFRHYGPMAQEIFHYFGEDTFGTIGNDTTLATADMDGIMMICLQALEKRTRDLNSALNELRTEKIKAAQLQTSFDELRTEISRMKSQIKLLTDAEEKKSHINVSLTTSNEGE